MTAAAVRDWTNLSAVVNVDWEGLVTCSVLEGGVHGGAVDGGEGEVPVGDGEADEGAADAGFHERPERRAQIRHDRDSAQR